MAYYMHSRWRHVSAYGVYILHWLASALHHIFEDGGFQEFDVIMIHVLCLYRVHFIMEPVILNLITMALVVRLLLPSWDSYGHLANMLLTTICTYRMSLAISDLDMRNQYLLSFSAASILYGASFIQDKRIRSVLTIGFHLCLGIQVYYEQIFIDHPERVILPRETIMLLAMFMFALPLHLARVAGMPTGQIRSIPSMTAAILFAPSAFWSIWPEEMGILVCMSYLLIDVILAMRYYPEHFPLLDGWLHHGGTAMLEIYCLMNEKNTMRTLGLAEIPTLFLLPYRIWPSATTKWIRMKVFPLFFVIFRVLLIGINLVSDPEYLSDRWLVLGYLLFTSMNVYWFLQMMNSSKKKKMAEAAS